MKSGRMVLLLVLLGLACGCGGGGSGDDSGGGGTPVSANNPVPFTPGNNVVPVTVNGSLCSAGSYPNKPCVAVTVCTPGTSDCRTVTDILLDTASYGIRIFSQVLDIPLTPVASGSGSLGECVHFGDGSSRWGPVQMADVILGGEPAVRVPIQVIDSTFGALPSACQNADRSPDDARFNGILGIGPLAHDCGPVCASSAAGMYYSCSGSACTAVPVPLASQVQNPVALLPYDNNGVMVQLPAVSADGSPFVEGSLLLGVGTQQNNTPAVVTTFGLDQQGNFITSFNGTSYQSFIDTGSNGLFFPSPSSTDLPNCASPNSVWFCPPYASPFSGIATQEGATGAPTNQVPFQIRNFTSLLASSNRVFPDIGGSLGGDFDWGLPFYLGRNVYIGIAGSASSLGSGPYFAY